MASVLVAVATVTGNAPRMLDLIYKLYNPWAAFVAVVVLVEYVVLKGADRSAIYRRELDATRKRRGEDLLGFQMVERELNELRGEVERKEDDAAIRRIEELLEKLRGHV